MFFIDVNDNCSINTLFCKKKPTRSTRQEEENKKPSAFFVSFRSGICILWQFEFKTKFDFPPKCSETSFMFLKKSCSMSSPTDIFWYRIFLWKTVFPRHGSGSGATYYELFGMVLLLVLVCCTIAAFGSRVCDTKGRLEGNPSYKESYEWSSHGDAKLFWLFSGFPKKHSRIKYNNFLVVKFVLVWCLDSTDLTLFEKETTQVAIFHKGTSIMFWR